MSRWTMDEIESLVQEFRSSHGLGNEEPIKIKSFFKQQKRSKLIDKNKHSLKDFKR